MTGTGGAKGQTEKFRGRRKNKRVNMRFPVTVEVPVGGGRTRRLQAHTVVVSHAGATLDLDVSIPVETGIQVTPPFGGAILAEVTDAWVDSPTNRQRVSVRLIDPSSWTSPDRLTQAPAAATITGCDAHSLMLSPRAWQMLEDYAAYLCERGGDEELEPAAAAEKIIEQVFLSDPGFQNWFAAKIMEDLQAWEEASVVRQ